MREKSVVPALGERLTEATVAKWWKNAGYPVEADEPVVELETDKVNLEVPSPITGVLSEINEKDGSVVAVGALLGSISQNSAKTSPKKIQEIKKIEPSLKENNVIKLDPIKKDPKIVEEKSKENTQDTKPLVWTEEGAEDIPVVKKRQNKTL